MPIFKPNPLKKWFIIIFAPPGQGKSIEQARLSEKTLQEYAWIEKHYKKLPHRLLATNQALDLDYIAKENNFDLHWVHEHYLFWQQPEEIRYCPRKECWKGSQVHEIHDIDLFCDEGATLFPATSKGADDDLPMWLKKFITQHRHNGIRIVLLSIDFMGINILARRCVWDAWYMRKIIGSRDPSPTLPPINWIWGLYSQQRISPELIKANANSVLLDLKLSGEKKREAMQDLKLIGGTQWHLITRHKCKLYDTTQNVAAIDIKREIEHISVACKHPGCGYVHKTHRLK